MSDTRRHGFSKLRLQIRITSLLLALALAHGEARAAFADDAQALVATSDVIFTGRATAIEFIWPIWLTPANAESGGPYLRTRFEIETGWKGVRGKVFSVDASASFVYIPCESSLRIGGTYTVFARGSPARGFRTGTCMVMAAGNEERFLPALEAYRARVAAFDAAGAGADAVRAKARFLSENHDWPSALEAFEQLFAMRPGDEEAIAGRGRALSALDRHEDALADFDRMLALDPGDTEAQRNRIVALFKLGRTHDIDRQTAALAKGEFAGINLVDRDLSGLDLEGAAWRPRNRRSADRLRGSRAQASRHRQRICSTDRGRPDRWNTDLSSLQTTAAASRRHCNGAQWEPPQRPQDRNPAAKACHSHSGRNRLAPCRARRPRNQHPKDRLGPSEHPSELHPGDPRC
jgi:tetratricopeptide (TPR) repeat protein